MKVITLSILLCLCSLLVSAQTLFDITSTTPLADSWPLEDQELIESLANNRDYEKAWKVQLGDLPRLQSVKGQLSVGIPLPGFSDLSFKTVDINLKDARNFFYNERVLASTNGGQYCEIFLNCHEGRIIASITSET